MCKSMPFPDKMAPYSAKHAGCGAHTGERAWGRRVATWVIFCLVWWIVLYGLGIFYEGFFLCFDSVVVGFYVGLNKMSVILGREWAKY